MPLRPPVLSEIDPVVDSESGIDPLGLLGIYERLADRVLPALTVRMSRPRYVTAMAVSARVCAEWDEETLAADEVTPPWLVFEWFVVEGFVRSREKRKDEHGVPGRLKVETALRNKLPVSAASYLKTPKVFGFSGIYKRLAVALRVLTEDFRLDDAGYELVSAWERDQDLEGFLDGREGAGAAFRSRLRRAVEQGLASGHTEPQSGSFWDEITTRLEPAGARRSEKNRLSQLLRNASRGTAMTRELIEALEAGGKPVLRDNEPDFLRKVGARGTEDLRLHLGAIDAFELLCRPITDAFNLIRHLSTTALRGPVGAADLAKHGEAAGLIGRLKSGVQAIHGHQVLLDWEPGVRRLVDAFGEVRDAPSLFDAVLAHHETAEREKPPDGKRPWLERARDNRVIVRAAYGVDSLPTGQPPYVHEYRIPTLSGFLHDLGVLS